VVREIVLEIASGILNRTAESSIALRVAGHGTEARNAGAQARALPIREEEGLVLANGAADRQPVLITAELWRRLRLREKVTGVQVFVAKELKQGSMELIPAGFADHHYGAAVGTSVFRRVRV